MNWFSTYYQTALNSNSWLTDLSPSTPIFFLLFSIFLGASLFPLKQVKVTAFIIAALSAYACKEFLNPIFSIEFLHTGSRLDSLSLDTFVVMVGMILGPILLGACVIKKFRSLDRMMTGLLIAVTAWLIFGYHMLLINGGMKYDLKLRETDLVSVLKLSDQGFKETCSAMRLDCREGAKTEKLHYLSSEVERQANDYLSFYREQGKIPLLFSDSNALITQNTPYAYAYIETSTKFRWVIDTNTPQKIFTSYKALFALVVSAIVYFWSLFIFTAMFLHHLMGFLRQEKALDSRMNHLLEEAKNR